MSNFKKPTMRSEQYMAWVRTLPCRGCGVYGQQQAHHNIASRYGSSKQSDFWTMSLCATCHELLHAGWRRWEDEYGTQDRHCLETIEQAIRDGVLVVDKKCARALSNG